MLEHFRATLHWSNDERFQRAEVLAAAIGMTVPVAVGFWIGRPSIGFVAALGALAVGRVEPGKRLPTHVRREVEALAPMICAMLVVMGCGVLGGFRDVGLLVPIALVAIVSGYSRPVAVAATRFVLFATIMSAMPPTDAGTDLGLLAMALSGALLTSALSFIFGMVGRAKLARAGESAPAKHATAQQKYQRWRRSLGTLTGWSYSIRLVAALGAGVIANHLWPGHHLHWIGVTVAVLTTREPEIISVRATQRALGTALGIAATGLVFRSAIATPMLVSAVGALAGLRALLRTTNYLAYSIVMTPLIVLIIDQGNLPTAGLLTDRLVATVIGGGLVTAAGMAAKWATAL